jgi:RND family efflux transporter MFP subunit
MTLLPRILIPLLILALGFGAWKWLGKPIEEPTPVRQVRQKLKTTRLELHRTRFPVILETQGTIRAHHTTILTAQVSGTVLKISDAFDDGAFFDEGEILLELDPADLQAQKVASESRLARAEAALAQEEARAKQARLNWEDIGYKDAPSPLVLRIPQLKEANANITAARADLDQALRNLERSKIRAPFAGRVKSRMVGLGQAVGGTTPLGEIFATDYAEIRLPLSASQLTFARLPSKENDSPVNVTLTDALSSNSSPGTSPQTWQAKIVRTEGALDDASRELFAIARIDDPFGLQSGKPELRIGQPVRAAVEGVTLDDVFVLPRSALRGVNRVFLIEKENLTIQRTDVQALWSTSEVLVVRDGFEEGDWLATSRLPYAPNGAPVDIVEEASAADVETNPKPAKSSGS